MAVTSRSSTATRTEHTEHTKPTEPAKHTEHGSKFDLRTTSSTGLGIQYKPTQHASREEWEKETMTRIRAYGSRSAARAMRNWKEVGDRYSTERPAGVEGWDDGQWEQWSDENLEGKLSKQVAIGLGQMFKQNSDELWPLSTTELEETFDSLTSPAEQERYVNMIYAKDKERKSIDLGVTPMFSVSHDSDNSVQLKYHLHFHNGKNRTACTDKMSLETGESRESLSPTIESLYDKEERSYAPPTYDEKQDRKKAKAALEQRLKQVDQHGTSRARDRERDYDLASEELYQQMFTKLATGTYQAAEKEPAFMTQIRSDITDHKDFATSAATYKKLCEKRGDQSRSTSPRSSRDDSKEPSRLTRKEKRKVNAILQDYGALGRRNANKIKSLLLAGAV